MSLIREERPVARKAHGCNACLGRIDVGERYVRQRVADGSEAWTWKAHLLCSAAYFHVRAEYGLYDDEDVEPAEVAEVVGLALTFPLLAPVPA